MGRTTADGYLLVGVSSNLGGNTFSLTELAIGTRTDSETVTLPNQTPLSCRRVANLETVSQLGKKTSISIPGRKEGSHRFEKWMYWCSFSFSGEILDLGARLVSFVFACLSVVHCFYRVIIFLQAEENMGREKKTNGDANQVVEEHNRRASIFLPTNPLKITRFGSFATCWG